MGRASGASGVPLCLASVYSEHAAAPGSQGVCTRYAKRHHFLFVCFENDYKGKVCMYFGHIKFFSDIFDARLVALTDAEHTHTHVCLCICLFVGLLHPHAPHTAIFRHSVCVHVPPLTAFPLLCLVRTEFLLPELKVGVGTSHCHSPEQPTIQEPVCVQGPATVQADLAALLHLHHTLSAGSRTPGRAAGPRARKETLHPGAGCSPGRWAVWRRPGEHWTPTGHLDHLVSKDPPHLPPRHSLVGVWGRAVFPRILHGP